jgi:periplasmic protein TonB
VLALAIVGLLAVASPADTAVRVPGTTLRFGLDDTAISARGFTATGTGARKGRCRFFGLTSDATLTFEAGRLARVEFAVSDASTYEIAYVHDQLTAMGYRKSCEPPTPRTEVCDWTARTHIHLEVKGASLKASVVPASVVAVAPAAARDTALATGSRLADRVSAPLKGTPAPAGPPARDTARYAGPPRAIPPAAPAVVPALPRPPGDTVRAAAPIAGAVPMLPETLAVKLPGRTSPYAEATLMSEPRCGYPETARAAGIQGRVWVFAYVDTDGRVIRVQLKSGIPVLNATALACVRDWSFKPVTWQGAPCRYWVLVPVTFTAH